MGELVGMHYVPGIAAAATSECSLKKHARQSYFVKSHTILPTLIATNGMQMVRKSNIAEKTNFYKHLENSPIFQAHQNNAKLKKKLLEYAGNPQAKAATPTQNILVR